MPTKGKQIINLYVKDFILLFKDKIFYGSVLLFSITSIITTYYILDNNYNQIIINSLFWIILLFSVTTAITTSLIKEPYSNKIYYYSIVSPLIYLISKILLNITLTLIISFSSFIIFYMFFGNFINNILLYIIAIVLNNIGLSLILTFTSSITSYAKSSFILIAILSFPLIIPVLIFTNKIIQMTLYNTNFNYTTIIQFILLNILICFLILILFPYLWKE